MDTNDPITRRNTGAEITRDIIDPRIRLESTESLSPAQIRELEARAKRARLTAIDAVARVGEDHLGGGLEIIDPLELVLSVMDRAKGDDFFIAQGHVAAGYFAALAQHGYITPEDVVNGFRTSEPIGGHVTPIAGGSMNTGRLGNDAGGVGMALWNQCRGNGGVVYLFTSDGSMQEGSAMEALEIAANRKAPCVVIPALNAMQLSGTTQSIDPCGNPAAKARAAGLTVIETPSCHDFAGFYKTLREATLLCRSGKGPVFIYPAGIIRSAREVLKDPAKWGFSPDDRLWVPGSIMGRGIREWEDGIIATINAERNGKPLPKPVNHHDGNLKKENVAEIRKALELTPEETAALKVQPVKTTFRARPSSSALTGYEFDWPETLPVSASETLVKGDHGADWVSPRKGVNLALKALAAKNGEHMAAVDMDLGGSTQLGVLQGPLGKRFIQAGIRERGAFIAAAGYIYEALTQFGGKPGKDKLPTVAASTFAAFIQAVGREGLEFADYQQDIFGHDEDGLTVGVPVKVISSHNGLNPGKDGITAHALHGIDLAFELPRMKRAFVPADANHAIHVMREMYRLNDFAMYIGPRDVVPVIGKQNQPSKPLFGPDWKFEPVTLVRQSPKAKTAIVVTGPVLYRGLMAREKLEAKKQPADVYFVGQVKPFPVARIVKILQGYDSVVTVEDGFVGGNDSARGLAGLVASCLAQHAQKILDGRTGKKKLPGFAKVGSPHGQTMSESPLVIYDRYGIAVSDIVKAAERALK